MARTTPVNSGYNIINGTTTGSNGSKVDTWLEWKVTSQSIANNTSNVRIVLYSAATTSSSTKWEAHENFGYVGYNNGNKQYLNTTYNFSNYNVNKFGDYTYTITHNTDGTKTLTLQGSWSTSHSSYISGGSVSGSVTLPQIARASTITSLSTKLGTQGTINITRSSSSFTHTITYSFGNATGTITTKTASTSVTWTPPVSLISEFSNQTSKTGTLTCTTYNGNTSVGTSTSTLTLSVPLSTLGNVTGTIGNSLTLTATNACASGLTYTYQYSADGSSWSTIGTEKVSSKTQSWTPPTSLIANISNATSKAFSIRVVTYVGTATVNTATATATLSIPKITSANVSGTIGSSLTISLTKPHNNLSATITYSFGNATGTIATKTASASVSWTPPTSLLSEIPSSASGNGTITITTYNGTSGSAGSNQYTLTLSAASSVVPTSSMTLTMVNDNNTVNGWGVYVQGYSKVKVTLTGTGTNGSNIKSMSVSGQNLNGTSNPNTTPATLEKTSDTITTRGTLTYKGNVTDTRNRSATEKSSSITVYSYAPPSISNFVAYRVTSGGVADDSGTYLKVTFSRVYSSVNSHNTATVTLKYKTRSSSTWTSYGTVTSGSTLNLNLDVSNNYDVQLFISDALTSNVASNIVGVASSERVLNVNASGTGLAIGGFSTMSGYFQEYYPARFDQNVTFVQGVLPRNTDGIPVTSRGSYTGSGITGDADDMTEVGAYWVYGANIAHLPTGNSGYGILITDRSSNGTFQQEFFQYNAHRLWFRLYTNSQWYEWVEITHGSSYTALATFGNYYSVGTKVTLSEPYTNFNSIVLRFGDNDSTGGMCLQYVNCRVLQAILTSTSTQYFGYQWLDGSTQSNLTLKWNSATEVEITAHGGANFGLRQIYGLN